MTLNGYPVNSKTQPRDKSDVITNRYGVFSDGVMTDIARVLCQAGFAVTNGSALACYISKCDLKGGIKKGDLGTELNIAIMYSMYQKKLIVRVLRYSKGSLCDTFLNIEHTSLAWLATF